MPTNCIIEPGNVDAQVALHGPGVSGRHASVPVRQYDGVSPVSTRLAWKKWTWGKLAIDRWSWIDEKAKGNK
jgi:hypothetical protein